MQHTDYYPFGMVLEQDEMFDLEEVKNRYLYNGKELQDDDIIGVKMDWYDYGARFYDPSLGRWHVIDNKAEKYFETSPYTYTLNNPIKYIDPDGNEVTNPNKIVLNNKKLISKIRVLNQIVQDRIGLENEDFQLRISGGDRYDFGDFKGNLGELIRPEPFYDGKFSLSNDETIHGSATKSKHLISIGARAVDLQIDNNANGKITKELIAEIAKDLGFTYVKMDYKDGHIHIQLPESDSEKGLIVTEDKNRPTYEELNKELTEEERLNDYTKAAKSFWERLLEEED